MKPNLLRFLLLIFFVLSFGSLDSWAQNTARDMTLELKSSVRKINSTQTEVQVCWRSTLPASVNHAAIRKPLGQYFWNKSFTIATTDTCFLDTIPTNSVYEYCVRKDTSIYGIPIYGYIASGIVDTARIDRGNVIVVLDTTHFTVASAPIRVYLKSLIGDGWQYDVFEVDSATTVATVKSGIVSRYNANPTRVNTVSIIGNVRVPYSGGFNSTFISPDGHSPQHDGAWPADVYYGDMQSSSWTDATVNVTTGTRAENDNTVGDGKFDQSTIPTLTELIVGRVDLSDLPGASTTESALLSNYMYKNQAYRNGAVTILDRALLDDNLGLLNGEAFGGTVCYRNMAPFYGYNSVNNVDYLTGLNAGTYKWSFGFGFGSYTSMSGVGTSTNLFSTSNDLRSIFNVFMGSYFPDWDNSNNFLRAPLAANGTILASVAGGRPNIYFHSMGMGETIGYSVWQTINNYDVAFATDLYPSYHYGSRFIHTALMGDPTLRLDYVNPPRNMTFCKDSSNSDTMQIFWQAPFAEVGVDSYYVFRAENELDSFIFLGSTSDTMYKDTIYDVNREYYYMVRASKMDTTCSGYYRNLSQGLCERTQYLDKTPYHDTTYFCIGDSVQIGRNVSESEQDLNYEYTWTPGVNLNDSQTYRTYAHINSSTTFYLQTRDKFGFMNFDTVVAILHEVPSNGINLVSQSTSCGDTATFNSSPTPSSSVPFTWTFENATPGTITANNSIGPHTVIYNIQGSNEVKLEITYGNGLCYYADSILVSVNCISLPVELINFQARKEGEAVYLDWQTASEQNCKAFEVWRSIDGESFKFVGVVSSKSNDGYSNHLLSYQLVDLDLPNSNHLFYKLRKLDLDGGFEESKVVYLEHGKTPQLYPNPFNNLVEWPYQLDAEILVYSSQGQLIKTVRPSNGLLDLSDLPFGVYEFKWQIEGEWYFWRGIKI